MTVPAFTLPVGTSSVTATATDRAGNTGRASAVVTLNLTTNGLCLLTRQFIQASAKYQSLPTRQRSEIGRLTTNLCTRLAAIQLTPAQKVLFIRVYDDGVAALVPAGWVTPSQATLLTGLASCL